MAFKFLAPGAVGPFTGVAWPPPGPGGPGAWLHAPPGSDDDRWVHACRAEDLAWWLGEELWRIELGGTVHEEPLLLSATRGRLVSRVEAWDAQAARLFAEACAERARQLAASTPHPQAVEYADDAASCAAAGKVGEAAYVLAVLAQLDGGDAAFSAERLWQSRWLMDRLGLR